MFNQIGSNLLLIDGKLTQQRVDDEISIKDYKSSGPQSNSFGSTSHLSKIAMKRKLKMNDQTPQIVSGDHSANRPAHCSSRSFNFGGTEDSRKSRSQSQRRIQADLRKDPSSYSKDNTADSKRSNSQMRDHQVKLIEKN